MIIFQWRDTYVRPHKHLNKEETCHIIEGGHVFFVLSDDGEVLHRFEMQKEKNFICRAKKNLFHMSVPVSEYVIFHESKTGPFELYSDSIYPEWAPDETAISAAKGYMNAMINKKGH